MFMNAKSILFIKFVEPTLPTTYPQLVLNLLLDSPDCVPLAQKYQEWRPKCAEDLFTKVSHRHQDVPLLEFLLVLRNNLQAVAFSSSHLNKEFLDKILSLQSYYYLQAFQCLFRPGDAEDLVADDLHQPQLPGAGLRRVQLAAGPGFSKQVCHGVIPAVINTVIVLSTLYWA